MGLQGEWQRRIEGRDVLPVKGEAEEPQSFVVGSTAEKVGEDGSLGPRRMHGGQARDGDGVQKGEDVGGEELVEEHADEAVPEEAEGFRALDVLPMKPLERLDRGQSAPVDCLNMPYADGAQNTANTIPKETNGDDAQDNG